MQRIGLGLLCYVLSSTPVTALEGTHLYEDCKGDGNLACAAYVHGFLDGMVMGYAAKDTARTGVSAERRAGGRQ